MNFYILKDDRGMSDRGRRMNLLGSIFVNEIPDNRFIKSISQEQMLTACHSYRGKILSLKRLL